MLNLLTARCLFILGSFYFTLQGIAQVSSPPFFAPLLADGFDFPFGLDHADWQEQSGLFLSHNGAISTAQTYIYKGKQHAIETIYSIAKGKVVEIRSVDTQAKQKVIIEHYFLENNRVDTIYSIYKGLSEVNVALNTVVERQEAIGTIRKGDATESPQLKLQIQKATVSKWTPAQLQEKHRDLKWCKQNYYNPSSFIEAHAQIKLPVNEPHFLLAIKHKYLMHYYQKGKFIESFDIALSQDPDGHKQQEGDNRLPEGAYNIIQKSTGPFSGATGPWFGSGWMRLNYPNPYDAAAGLDKGWITKAQYEQMVQAFYSGKEPSKRTKLGGGISIHGWNGNWIADGDQNLTWGCISMQNEDLTRLYPKLPLQTKIIIVP